MCKSNCENPQLRPKDGKCSEELVKRCHGKEESHPCNDKSKEKKEKN